MALFQHQAPALSYDILLILFSHLDGTSLTFSSGVNRAWREAAASDHLWRKLVTFERCKPFSSPLSVDDQPPSWAVHRSRGGILREEKKQTALLADERTRSWRQAYRLLALWERGRPHCWQPCPVVTSYDSSTLAQVPTPSTALPNLNFLDGSDSECGSEDDTTWAGREVESVLHKHYLRTENDIGGLFPNSPTSKWRFRTSGSGQFTAIVDTLGRVYLFDGGSVEEGPRENRQVRCTPLPTFERGMRAGDVTLVSAFNCTDGSQGEQVWCFTRSGLTWHSWTVKDGVASPGHSYHGFFLRQVTIAKHDSYVLMWSDGRKKDGKGSFSLYDLCNPGMSIFNDTTNHDLAGCTLLTPLGPFVAWSSSLHFRIIWTTVTPTPQRQSTLPSNPSRQKMYGTRPMRTYFAAEYPELSGKDVVGMRPDEDVPGRIELVLEIKKKVQVGGKVYLEGWGQHRKLMLGLHGQVLEPLLEGRLAVELSEV